MSELCFFNPYAEIRFTANRLPHWQQEGAVYFVTFRLADAVPHNLRTRWESEREAWLRAHPQPWSAEVEREYHERFSSAIERWLDAGYGSCILRRKDCARIVAEALRHFDGERLALISSVVMPNHVHALFMQNADCLLENLLRSWKSFSSRKINLLLGRDAVYGNRIISIGSFVMKSISPIACVISAGILQRHGCTMGNSFCTKASLRGASSSREARVQDAFLRRRTRDRRSLFTAAAVPILPAAVRTNAMCSR